MAADRNIRCDVAVVGAGVVGAAVALALAQAGRDVAVVEPRAPADFSTAQAHDLRTYAVSPASAALLGRLGAWRDVLAARACAYRTMRVWERDVSDELRFDAALIGEPQLGWIVEDALLRHVLWRLLAATSRVELVSPATVSGLARDGNATLALAEGGRISARLVVAADGAASPLRKLAGMAASTSSYGERAIVANVRTEASHEATAWQRFTRDGPLAFLPLSNGECSIVWSVKDATADALLAKDDDAFRAALGESFQHRLGAVTATSKRAALPLRLMHRRRRRPRRSREAARLRTLAQERERGRRAQLRPHRRPVPQRRARDRPAAPLRPRRGCEAGADQARVRAACGRFRRSRARALAPILIGARCATRFRGDATLSGPRGQSRSGVQSARLTASGLVATTISGRMSWEGRKPRTATAPGKLDARQMVPSKPRCTTCF